jgi:hypothetical protein
LLKNQTEKRAVLTEKQTNLEQRGQTRELFTEKEAPIPVAQTKEEALAVEQPPTAAPTEVVKEEPKADTKTMDLFGEANLLRTAINNGDESAIERATKIEEQRQRKARNAKVEEEKTTTDLYEAVADTLNNASGWDYQHCGRSRYEDATEMVNNLENHDFTAKEVSKFVKDFMAETETPPTIKDIAIGVADRVGAMITLNRYEDLTFHVNIK